jgi:LPXTG-motif cell wall-anchored protein
MATKTGLTENQKIALGIGAVVLIGGIAYLVLKRQNKIVVTASSSNPSAVTPANEPILTKGTWNITEEVNPDGSATVTATFNNVSTWLSEAGTMTAIQLPYPLTNWSVAQDTTGQLNLAPGATGGWPAFTVGLDRNGYLSELIITGGTNAVINGTVVIKGTVPAAYLPSSATTQTSSGTYG